MNRTTHMERFHWIIRLKKRILYIINSVLTNKYNIIIGDRQNFYR